MITIIARLTAKDGEFQNLRACALELAAAVAANEPGNQLYAICEGAGPTMLVLIERYADAQALEAHRGSEHLKTIGRKIGATLVGKPDILFRLTDCEVRHT
jgi:quinol monooxygenase YgiN